MHNEGLITAKAKAAELGISRATLTRKVQAGEITPAFRADGHRGVTLFYPAPAVSTPPVDAAGVSSS